MFIRKSLLSFLILSLSMCLYAQENEKNMDLKFGTGIGFMGSGDLTSFCFENELNYKLNHYFSSSVSIGIGRSVKYRDNHNDYLQGSLNLFISPFKNNKQNNFKIGVGYTLINETVSYLSSSYYYNNVRINNYEYSAETINGFNVIIENEYKINSKFLIGGKLFMTAGIEQGGIVNGGMIKFGIVL